MHSLILSVYAYTHQLVKNDSELLQKLRELITNPNNRNSNKYLCTGLEVEGIYLGIDFIMEHIKNFPRILTNTLAIDNLSHQSADLSRVLLKVFIEGKHVANITEDVSENGKYKIYDQGIFFGPYTDYLQTWFKDSGDLSRAVFVVHNEKFGFVERDRVKKPSPIAIRMPIIDLDHIELIQNELYEADAERGKKELFVLNL